MFLKVYRYNSNIYIACKNLKILKKKKVIERIMKKGRKGRCKGRGRFIVIVLPAFVGLKAIYNVLD